MAGIKKDIKFRVYLSFILLCAFAAAIIFKAAHIQVTQGKQLVQLFKDNYIRVDTIQPDRGNIYSDDGSLLSTSLPVFDIFVDFKTIHKDTFTKHVNELAAQLSKLFNDKPAAEYLSILNQQYTAKHRYFKLKNDISYDKYIAIQKLPILKYGPNKGGFKSEAIGRRINPFQMLGNRMIGSYRPNVPNVGLEGSFDDVLKGKIGVRVERKLSSDVWMPIEETELDPENGKDIVTNINVNTQDIAENALLKVLEKEQAAFGTCIVMETKTGKIKAMANLGRQANGSYAEDYNYALQPIEPGSTFKINALLSAIDDGFVTLDDKINANGGVCYFANQKMSDSHLGLGTISIKDAFSHSSNVACAKLIYNNYLKNPAQFIKHLKDMQIDKPTGVDILGEAKPRIARINQEFTNPASLAWLAIGYEVMVTPLRTCMVYNTIANNGVMMKPYIVNEVMEYGRSIKKIEPTVLAKNICKPTTIAQLKDAAYAVVEEGTGKALKNNVYSICGKTGTAQVADKGIKYSDKVYHGSFVGFFPKDDPMYTICVVIRTKKGASNYYGGQIALPVFKEVADRLYAISTKHHIAIQNDTIPSSQKTCANGMLYANMQFLNKQLNCFTNYPASVGTYINGFADSTGNLTLKAVNVDKVTVPNVIGMGLRDAVKVLELAQLHVNVKGKGKVISQSLQPGNNYRKGQLIYITLE
jgi:cell division protein FtsI (penicillin-binding protein 3)